MEINILSYKETNGFYDSSKSSNGGGYSQPKIEFEVADKNIHGTIWDTSCGDFGRRYDIEASIDGEQVAANLDSVGNHITYTDADENNPVHKELDEALYREFRVSLFPE